MPLSSTPGQQRESDQLAEENRRLRDEVEKWRAYYAGRGALPPNPSGGAAPVTRTTQISSPAQTAPAGATLSNPTGANRPSSTPTEARTHKVQAGDTPSSIARKYGVKVDALLAANPGLNPKRLQVGQVLNVPAP